MGAVIFSILAALFWSSNAVLASKATERVNATTLNYVSAFPAALVLLVAALASGQAQRLGGVTPPELLFLALTGIANYVVGRSLYYASIQKIGAGRTVPIANLSVLVAPLLASFLLGEALTARVATGLLLVFAGLYFLTMRQR